MPTVHSAAQQYRNARWVILGEHRKQLQAAQAKLRRALREATSDAARQAAWREYELDAAPIRKRTKELIHDARADFRQCLAS